MLTINTRNVNGAWPVGVRHIARTAVAEESRAGRVLAMPTPVTTVYQRPQERVLFCERRDANPFFHLFESMWMLMGRKDATWLDTYVGDFSRRFAEPSGTMHGAYGARWRWHFELANNTQNEEYADQIGCIVELLRRDPHSRQAVLTMWDPSADLGATVRDKPCNTHCYFRVNSGWLDMTILCRSNDMVWGAYGANAVHMSVLQEYVAAQLNVPVGTMYQVSNNFHVYADVFERMFPMCSTGQFDLSDTDFYRQDLTAPSPLFLHGWDYEDLSAALREWSADPTRNRDDYPELFGQLLVPMAQVHQYAKLRELAVAHKACDRIAHADWRTAARSWVGRRLRRQEARRAADEAAQAEAKIAAAK